VGQPPTAAKRAGRLDEELERLGRIPLLIVDEVGYIPFDPEAAALFFALISSRYERRSLIVSSNKTFSAWAGPQRLSAGAQGRLAPPGGEGR
jgi:DNA replication protein DnaC